ncbi:hypothetical protein GCM10009416_05660 [Craurococcus roseus]|uniref:Uncharacterized protein n=1 Tax=Craurococcus roseus TaxID=77585 RepID=A0ABN1EMU4_9PROT
MLRVVLASLVALAAPAAAQPAGEDAAQRPAPRAPAREATVANDTGRVLRELFVHPAGAEDRGPDRLGNGVLPPRASLRVPLDRRPATCAWQAVAVFEDGEEERRRFDACRGAPRAAFADTGPAREVEVQNDTDVALRELYLSPPGSRERGRDRLGSETVEAGGSHVLRLRGAGQAACVFDVRAVFADDTEQARERVDLCRARRMAFGDATAPVREVPVVNRGRAGIRELYARPAGGGGGWGADRLGAATIAPRDDFRLRVRSRDCRFDLRAVSASNREEVKDGVDLCAVQGVVFGERPDEAPRRVVLLNDHRRTVRQAFLAPTKGSDWGEDVLGAAVIIPGARYEAAFEGGCHADLRVVFDTEAAEERRAIDICAETLIALRPGWTLDERLAPPPAPQRDEEDAATPAPKAPAAALPSGGVRLRNAAAAPLVALHADPIGAPRGPDRLDHAELPAGESMEFAPPEDLPPGPARCLADLTAVFGDGRELRLPARDICAGGEVVLE